MRLDIERSLIEIGGEMFPACNVECPPDESDDPPRDYRLGTIYKPDQFEVYVPMENGLFAAVYWQMDSRIYSEVLLYSRHCSLDRDIEGDRPLWLPVMMSVQGKVVMPWKMHDLWRWTNWDEDWLVGFLRRIARYPVQPVEGPAVKLLPLETLRRSERVVSQR